MAQVTEAIYSGGVLKPTGNLSLRESQRVRLIVEPLDEHGQLDRSAALQRLLEGIAGMKFSWGGKLPAREDLHDRS